MHRHLASPTLIVDGGIHAAAAVALSIGESAVGADSTNAVVVSDLPARTAFRLDRRDRAVRLVAVDCDVVADGKTIARGRERAFTRSARLNCGGIAFRLDLPDAGPPTRGEPRRGAWGFSAGVASTVALLAAAAVVAAPSRLAPVRVADLSQDAPAPPVPKAGVTTAGVTMAAAPVPAKRMPDAKALLGELRQRLASADLDPVAVDLQPDGSLIASGAIPPAKGESWHAAVRWFDTVAQGRAVLVDGVRLSAAPASLQVQAVYTGRPSYIIDGEGQKLFVGATVADGGVIQAIEHDRVLVRRGDRLVAVRF